MNQTKNHLDLIFIIDLWVLRYQLLNNLQTLAYIDLINLL